jgi:hypothetical protein
MNPDETLAHSTHSSEYGINPLILSQIFKRTTASYKFFWLRSIIRLSSKKHEATLNFKEIMLNTFSEVWFLVNEHKLSFGLRDDLAMYVQKLQMNNSLPNNAKRQDIYNILIHDNEIDSIIEKLTKYVPYAMLSPFLPDVKKKSGNPDRESYIEQSKLNPDSLYRLNTNNDGKVDSLTLSSKWFNYISENYLLLIDWIDFHLVQFLEARNPNVPAIASKLYPPDSRNLTKQRKIWQKYLEQHEVYDIYTNELISEPVISLDHFVPWSFVAHDQIWNLTPTSQTINSTKSNKIILDTEILHRFSAQQYEFYLYLREEHNAKYLEQYYSLMRSTKPTQNEFISQLERTITQLNENAIHIGFENFN